MSTPAPARFTPERRAWFERACALVDEDALRRSIVELTGIPSPAGGEARLARRLAEELSAGGLDGALQTIGGDLANAAGRLRGDGSGPSLMLYAPIDMHIAGNAAADGDGIDFAGRNDLVPAAHVEGDYVIGLGAENPKGHAACVLAAAAAIARANVPLRGDLLAGFGGGGMPVDGFHGIGCAYLLEHGYRPDYALIAKPGGAVAHEEVGLCWFEITLHGDYTYAGIGTPAGGRNAVLDAAFVAGALQQWFPRYTARNTNGLVAPRGSISAINGGWREKPAFVPAACTISIDLRVGPRTPPADAQAQLDEALDELRAADPGLRIERRLMAAVPGTSTDPENWIVQASIRAWEMSNGRAHVPRTGTSGATDANILRAHGVPTARTGMPPLPADAPFSGKFSMGVVSVAAMSRLTRTLIAVAIDTLTRTHAEIDQQTERKERS